MGACKIGRSRRVADVAACLATAVNYERKMFKTLVTGMIEQITVRCDIDAISANI
jgi:hypothetical protein